MVISLNIQQSWLRYVKTRDTVFSRWMTSNQERVCLYVKCVKNRAGQLKLRPSWKNTQMFLGSGWLEKRITTASCLHFVIIFWAAGLGLSAQHRFSFMSLFLTPDTGLPLLHSLFRDSCHPALLPHLPFLLDFHPQKCLCCFPRCTLCLGRSPLRYLWSWWIFLLLPKKAVNTEHQKITWGAVPVVWNARNKQKLPRPYPRPGWVL